MDLLSSRAGVFQSPDPPPKPQKSHVSGARTPIRQRGVTCTQRHRRIDARSARCKDTCEDDCRVFQMTRNIAWIFPLAHGHAAQFENFRDSCPPEIDERSVWVGMDFVKSGDWLANLRYAPTKLRSARHEMWHFRHLL